MMRLPTSLIIVALASTLVALVILGPLAQQDPPIVNPPIVKPPLVDLPTVGPPVVRPPRQQAFGGRVGASAAPALPQKPKRAFYYRLGDLKGVPYDTIEECTKVLQKAGGVGVCVYK
jgi:hypothetical protein